MLPHSIEPALSYHSCRAPSLSLGHLLARSPALHPWEAEGHRGSVWDRAVGQLVAEGWHEVVLKLKDVLIEHVMPACSCPVLQAEAQQPSMAALCGGGWAGDGRDRERSCKSVRGCLAPWGLCTTPLLLNLSRNSTAGSRQGWSA